MPNQTTPKFFVEPQQVFVAECQAHFDAQKKQAEGMADVTAQNFALEMATFKKKKRKADEALAARRSSSVFLEFDMDS